MDKDKPVDPQRKKEMLELILADESHQHLFRTNEIGLLQCECGRYMVR